MKKKSLRYIIHHAQCRIVEDGIETQIAPYDRQFAIKNAWAKSNGHFCWSDDELCFGVFYLYYYWIIARDSFR